MVQKVKRAYHRPSQTGYKKVVKARNVSSDTIGSLVCKFKVTGTVVALSWAGQKKKAINLCNQISEPDFRKALK